MKFGKNRQLLLLLIMVFLILPSAAVQAKTGVKKYAVKVTAKTAKTKKKLFEGQKLQLVVRDGTKKVKVSKVTFSSSKKKVASVSNKGVITAKKAGKAVITVKYKKKKAKVTVTVKPVKIAVGSGNNIGDRWETATPLVREGSFLALRYYYSDDDSNIIDKIYNGQTFSVCLTKWSGNYVFAYYNGKEGWVNSDYCRW